MGSPGLQILVVEDHQLLAVGLEVLLSELGHSVIETVASGEEAVAAAERNRPDLVVMDVALEGDMDGVEAAFQIRNRFGIRSLFLTGLSDPETRKRAVEADPVAFLDKTSSEADVARVIREFAEERSPS